MDGEDKYVTHSEELPSVDQLASCELLYIFVWSSVGVYLDIFLFIHLFCVSHMSASGKGPTLVSGAPGCPD